MSMFVVRDPPNARDSVRPEIRARVSSDDLIRLLELHGCQVIGSDEHGAFVRADHRLLFVRRVSFVEPKELRDALRAASIGPGRFDILLERVLRGDP
jgi:hypothetical protein